MRRAARIFGGIVIAYALAVLILAVAYPVSAMERGYVSDCMEHDRVSLTTCQCNARERATDVTTMNAPLFFLGLMKPDWRAVVAACPGNRYRGGNESP